MTHKFLDKFGHYSGNKRIDTSNFDEPDFDSEETLKKWLTGGKEIKFKRSLRRWKENISKTTDFEKIQIHMVGQSHIDCAWMWRFEQTRKKTQVTFKKAIQHAKMFPETFCFALSQPILLEWIKEDNLKLFKELQEFVKKGNIELVGGSYVEPDCMMPSGEAMIRQRLYGMRFYREYFGALPKIEWFLDSFGYNIGLPQILIKSGTKYFWTTKLTWNLDTTFPFVNFWWESPDGSRILSANFDYNIQVLENWEKFEIGRHLLKPGGKKSWNYTIDNRKLFQHVRPDICPHVGFFFGLSDGGHGPTHKEVAYANEYAKLNSFKWSRVERFYSALEAYSEEFPVWNDELYLENHRGCFSNHAEIKRFNRKYENLLVSIEILASITNLYYLDYEYPLEKLEKLWKITLKNQFHDVLPGSSIPEVFDEVWDDWNEQNAILDNILENIGLILSEKNYNNIEKQTAEICLFNPVSWKRKSRVFIPIMVFKKQPKLDKEGKPDYAKLILLNGDDEQYICQPIAADFEDSLDSRPAGWWTIVSLNPLSVTKAKIDLLDNSESRKIKQESNLESSENLISNSLVSVKINPKNGAMIELSVEGINHRHNLLKGNSSNLTFAFLDDDKNHPAWNLTPEYWNHSLNLSNETDVKIKITEFGPIFVTLEIRRTLGISPVVQKITLFKELLDVFLEFETDWKQKNVMLKILFSTSTDAKIATVDAAYSAIEFKTHPNVPSDKARYEKICHKYFDLSTHDLTWGLALLNEGKYAFDVNDSDMRLTLLRCCKYPLPAPEAWVNIEREENEKLFGHKVPEFSGLGPFKCRFALLPHMGGALINPDGTPNVIVKRKAEEFNMPVQIIPITNTTLKNKEFFSKLKDPLLKIITPNVNLATFKRNEWDKNTTIIVRFFEACGISTNAKVKFNKTLSDRIELIKAVDLIEREIEYPFKWSHQRKLLEFNIGKFEICTFQIYLNN
ncbi:MAG: alpha-mannosidase [Promethearchaeota archaeon]|nr:MAG: alpha-mannosidase [Candidatus Lokiarchaeota archaeon]